MMPCSSNATVLEIFLLMDISFILMVMMEYLLVLQYPSYKRAAKKSATSVNNTLANYIKEHYGENNKGKVGDGKQIPTVHYFDSVSKIVIPLLYFICICIYVTFIILN